MDMRDVKSSTVRQLGYDPATQTLRVAFKSGDTWDYAGATPLHFAQMTADGASVGKYLHNHIKPRLKGKRVLPSAAAGAR